MTPDDRGWSKFGDFMFSGSAGSFVIWALLVYALWSVIFEGPRTDDNSVSGGIFGDRDSEGD